MHTPRQPQAGGERNGLQTCSFSRPAIGVSRKLIAVNSLIEEPCFHRAGCRPFRYLSGSRGFPSIMSRYLRRCLPAPSPNKRLFPFHFGALWFRRCLRLRAFKLRLSRRFAAVHLDLLGKADRGARPIASDLGRIGLDPVVPVSAPDDQRHIGKRLHV